MGRILLVLLLIVVVVLLLSLRREARHKRAAREFGSWVRTGGTLGALILVSRLGRIPLVTLLTAMPFFIPSFREAVGEKPAGPKATMTHEEALLILGLEKDADAAAVNEAHRRLIMKNHPDKGGSDWLAAKINQARDVLLG